MKLILDTSALLSGKDFFSSTEYKIYTTPKVTDELKRPAKNDDRSDIERKFEYLVEAGLKIVTPSENSLIKVKTAAERTGDIKRLSPTDLEIIALALELTETHEEVIIFTDDYSIQNLSAELDLKFKSVTEKGIAKKFFWKYKCSGCGKEWKEPLDICPICGSKIKTKIKNKEKL